MNLIFQKQRTTDKREAGGGTRREKERGVHVSCSANKQKVNTGEGNTLTLDATERILSLPTQVSQKAILLATGQKQREKSQHLSPPEALGDNGEREIKRRNTFVCRDLNMRPFSLCRPPFSAAPPQRLLYCAKTRSCQRAARWEKRIWICGGVFKLTRGRALARADWSGLRDIKATQDFCRFWFPTRSNVGPSSSGVWPTIVSLITQKHATMRAWYAVIGR